MFERCLVEMDGGTWVATISDLMSQINVIETCVVIIIESKLFKYKVTFKQKAISLKHSSYLPNFLPFSAHKNCDVSLAIDMIFWGRRILTIALFVGPLC